MAHEIMYETGKRKNKSSNAKSGKPPGNEENVEENVGWEEQLWMNQAGATGEEIETAWRSEHQFASAPTLESVKDQFNKVRGQIEGGLQSFMGAGSFGRQNGTWSEGQNLEELKRWSSLIGGGLLTLFGLRRSLGSLTLMGLGMGLVYYALTGKRFLPTTTHSVRTSAPHTGRTGSASLDSNRPLTIQNIIVKAPVSEVYQTWANFENFPNFMQHIRSVTKTGDRTSHWVMDAETTRLEENKRIAWSSTGGDIKTSGQVTFNALPNNEVEVTVMLRYIPPAGIAGDLFAAFFTDPEGKLAEDLRNFKRFMEKKESAPENARA
jgi:uncharacterized membrane protein